MSDETSADDRASATRQDGLRGVAVVALMGAAAIHFAYAPTHFDDGTSHGVFFILVAWAQVGALVGLVRWRDRREPWIGAAAVSVAVTAVWLVSRTTGLIGGSPEDLGWADGMAAGLQIVTLAAAVAALSSWASKPAPAVNPVVGAVATVAVLGAVSLTLQPSVGHSHSDDDHHDEHAQGDDGHDDHEAQDEHADHADHDDHEGELVDVARAERCDLGFNTAAFNESAVPAAPVAHDDDGEHGADYTVEEWAEVFVDPDNPMGAGVSQEAAVAYITSDPVREEEVLSGGLAHSLEPDSWLPMTDEEECARLAEELQRTRDVAARYPTAQDAIDGGYRMVTPYLPAIASHYINTSYIAEFDIDNPAMLLYDGNGPDAGIVGISHYYLHDGEEPPEVGFTGDNDHWHRHRGLCMVDGYVGGGTNLTDEQCEARGGTKMDGGNQWMNHVWVVPGCESDYGLFSGANPSLVARGTGEADPFDREANTEPVPTGCGSGSAVDDDLDFDDPGDGPEL